MSPHTDPCPRAHRRCASAKLAAFVAAAVALTSPTIAEAAGPDGFAVQHFTVKPGDDRVFMVEGSEVAPAWSPYGGLWFHVVSNPLRFVVELPGADPIPVAVIERLMQLHAGVGVGLFGFAELELIVPLTLSGVGDGQIFPGLPDAGLSDILVRARFALLGRSERTRDGFGLNLGVGVGIPTGDREAARGDGGVTIQPKLAATVGAGPLLVALNLGANIRGESGTFENLRLGQELLFGLGAQVDIVEALALGVEVFGRTPFEELFGDGKETPIELVTGAKLRLLEGLLIEAGAGFGLTSGYGAPDYRIFAGVSWAERTPKDPDTDGDGIPDSIDQCPNDPEDFDGFQDEDGCPDLDNDGDGIPDASDKCPNDPEDFDGFEDEDGCPDPDNDGDGFCDPWVSEQGLSAKYAHICKGVDRCPDDAEDIDGFEDDDGCPDPDNDGDGICDPWVAEQGLSAKYAHVCKGVDQCPDAPETFNGYQDDDGCPDVAPLARVEGCKIVIGETVYFRTARSTIEGRSFPLLNEVARVIGELGDYDHVFIEGHTDNQGGAAYNRRLSEGRAKAVRTYLMRQGIPARKLKSKGYGLDRPIADNTTDEGRALNRRVDFNVIGGRCAE